MRAAQVEQYNKNNISVKMVSLDIPIIGERDVLVRVSAAGVNPLDNMISRGEVKMIVPYKLPIVAGNEFVGVVEKVGAKVSKFKVNDRVFARLPLTIMQALELMKAEKGKTIFISGGTGSVGAMAIPIAKAKGLEVITNGSAENKDRVLELGASRFIDYKTEDYSKSLSNIDYVLDTLGGNETEKQMQILKKGGKMVSLRAMPNGDFAKRMRLPMWKQIILGFAGSKFDKLAGKYGISYDFIFVESNGKQLQEVADLFEKLKIKPSIDTVYTLEEVNSALNRVANGRSKGKTVITM